MQKLIVSFVIFFIILCVVLLHKYIISSITLIKLGQKSASLDIEVDDNSNKLSELNDILESIRPTIRDAINELRVTAVKASLMDCENSLLLAKDKILAYGLDLDDAKKRMDYDSIMSLDNKIADVEIHISKLSNIINEHYVTVYNLRLFH